MRARSQECRWSASAAGAAASQAGACCARAVGARWTTSRFLLRVFLCRGGCKRGTLPRTFCLDLVTRGKIIVRTMWTHVIRPGLCRSPGGTVDIRHPCYAAERSYRNPTTSRCCPCLARSATAVRRVSAGGGDGDGDGEVAADGWGCGACTRRWVGIYTHDVHRRWGSVFWRSWARVIRGRLPVIGRPNADILHHGPPPAYAHGRGCWLGRGVAAGRCTRRRARGTRGGRSVSGARRAGGYRLSRPCSVQVVRW